MLLGSLCRINTHRLAWSFAILISIYIIFLGEEITLYRMLPSSDFRFCRNSIKYYPYYLERNKSLPRFRSLWGLSSTVTLCPKWIGGVGYAWPHLIRYIWTLVTILGLHFRGVYTEMLEFRYFTYLSHYLTLIWLRRLSHELHLYLIGHYRGIMNWLS